MATELRYVTGNGSITSGWRDAGGDYTAIDEVGANDGATTTLYSSTANQVASFLTSATSASTGATINSLIVHGVVFNPDPVESEYFLGVIVGGVQYYGPAISTTADGLYVDHTATFTVNPATSAAWTSTTVNNAEIVIKKGTQAPALRLTQMFKEIDYTAGGGGGISNKQYLGFF